METASEMLEREARDDSTACTRNDALESLPMTTATSSATLGRILLVEDCENDVQLTLAALGEANLAGQVVVVRDGQEALDFLRCEGGYQAHAGGAPAVVLLDLKLPRLDGMQVLEAVKNDDSLKTIPVVVLTSSREEADLARSYGLGVNAYVVKPVVLSDFSRALRQLGTFWAVVNQPPPGCAGRGVAR